MHFAYVPDCLSLTIKTLKSALCNEKKRRNNKTNFKVLFQVSKSYHCFHQNWLFA